MHVPKKGRFLSEVVYDGKVGEFKVDETDNSLWPATYRFNPFTGKELSWGDGKKQ